MRSADTVLVPEVPRPLLTLPTCVCAPRHMHALQDEKGKVIGARCRDRATGAETDVYARLVINATGAFADDVRRYSEVGGLFVPVCAGGSRAERGGSHEGSEVYKLGSTIASLVGWQTGL